MVAQPPWNSQNVTGDYSAVSFSGNATVNVYQNVAPQVVDQAMIRTAQEQLAAFPIDRLPARSPLPSGSRMPFWANPIFVGREADLQWLAQVLKANNSGEGKIAAITGLGGIGKTQLATEFVHRYGQYFAGGIFWLSFSDEGMVATQVAECGRPGHLSLHHLYDGLPLDDQVRLVLGAWQSRLPRLLVFDNCEDEQLLARWRPPTGASRVLITSRRAQWDQTLGIEMLPLGVLQRVESVHLLRKHIQGLQASDASLAAVAAELGDLPLALHLAGSFLNRYRHVQTLTGYLAQLRETDLLAHPSLTSGGRSATAHEQHLSRTFAVSYRNLDSTKPTDALALTLLARAIYFAPGEPIPHDLLLATLNLPDNQDIGLRQAEDALIRLTEVGLVESASDAGDIRLHRLVVAFLRKMISDPTAQDAVERALVRNYEHIRATFASGAQRTIMLDRLVDRMRSFVSQVGYTSADILRLFSVGSKGYRILALVAVGNFPDQSCFSIVLEAIRHSRSAFEQYYALLAARTMLFVLDEKQKDELAVVLSDEADNAYYIGQSTNRRIVRNRILAALRQSGSTQSFVGSSLHRQTRAGSTKDAGIRKLFVVTAGTIAAGVGQEITRQMNVRPQSDLEVMACYIDTARLVNRYSIRDGECFQMRVDSGYMEALYNNRANNPQLNKLLYPGLLPKPTGVGSGSIRYNGSGAVIVNHDKLKRWFSANMISLIRRGNNQANFSVALIVSAVGGTGSGSLEYLADVIAETAQEASMPIPVFMNIFILQPDMEEISQLGLANTLTLYAELSASRLARNGVHKLYHGRIAMVGWGSARRLASIEQLQETAATVIRLIHDPVSDLPATYEALGIDLHVLRDLDERTGLPTHLSSATPVTISLGRLEEQIIQRDAARLINNLVFGPESDSPTPASQNELFIGTLATSMAGDTPEERYGNLLQYLALGKGGEFRSLRQGFREQVLNYLPQELASKLEETWLSDKTQIVQQASAMGTKGRQLINEISATWLRLRRDGMVASSTLSLSSLRGHYQRLNNILNEVLKFAREMVRAVPDDSRVSARLKEVETAAKARGRHAERERKSVVESAVQEIQHNLRAYLDLQLNPIAIEVLKELADRSSEALVSLEAVLRRLERERQTMNNWGSVASRELKVGITHPLELPALFEKKALEGYYEQVSIFTTRSQSRERFSTEMDLIADFRRWLADQQIVDDLFKGDIDLLLPVAQKYTRNKIHEEVMEYSVLDVLLQGGEEALQQRLADAAELAQPLANFNRSFAPECEEIWHVCAYFKDEIQQITLQKAVARAFPEGRCSLLVTMDPTEIVVFYSADGLPMSAVQDLTERCLEAFLASRKSEWLNWATDTTQDTRRNLIPVYSSRDAEKRVIQQGIICRLCQGIGKDFSHYQDLPELKDCES
jgi:hypothetical protein